MTTKMKNLKNAFPRAARVAIAAICAATLCAYGDDVPANPVPAKIENFAFPNRPIPQEDFEGLRARTTREFLLDPMIFNVKNPRTRYQVYTIPLRERLERELCARFPDFDPRGNAKHRDFSEKVAFGNLGREKVSGLPESMRSLENAYNKVCEDSEESVFFQCAYGPGNLPWLTLLAAKHAEFKDKLIRKNFELLAHRILRELADDPDAPVLVYSCLEEYLPILAENSDDEWLKEMAAGTAFYQAAWRERGSGFADTVTDEGWEGFGENMDLAAEHFKRAAQLRPDNELAIQKLATIAYEHCSGSEGELFWQKKLALAQTDARFWGPQLGWRLLERWGGSAQFAKKVAQNLAENSPRTADPSVPVHLFWAQGVDYVPADFLRFCTLKFWRSIKKGYERECDISAARERQLPHWIFVRVALACGAFDDAQMIFEKHRDLILNASANLRKANSGNTFVFSFIDVPNFVYAFTRDENAELFREIWLNVRKKNGVPAEKIAELEALIRDGNAKIESRKIALALYEMLFLREKTGRYATFVEAPAWNFAFNRWYDIEKGEISPKNFAKFLELLAEIPGEFDAKTDEKRYGRKFELCALAQRFKGKEIPLEYQKIFADIALKKSPDVAENLLQQSLNNYWEREIPREVAKYMISQGAPIKNIEFPQGVFLKIFDEKSAESHEFLKLILGAGFSPNTTISGDSLLAYALRHEDFDAIYLLLEAGASPTMRHERVVGKEKFLLRPFTEEVKAELKMLVALKKPLSPELRKLAEHLGVPVPAQLK